MSHLSIYMQTIAPAARRATAVTTALALVLGTLGYSPVRAQQDPTQQVGVGAPQLSMAQLDQLVAPIAIYPDNLLGQILSASTYPLEIVLAARWSSTNPQVTGENLENAMQSQAWDPSVKALTAVPQVLKMMSEKLEWTQQLGEAYLSQPDDIAASVQRLRARADASGNLKSSEQVRVKRVPAAQPVAGIGPEYIVIEPVVPERIYVPVYDPFVVYGAWAYPDYRPFYWYPPGYVSVGVIGFGAVVVVGTALWATYNWNSRRVFVNPVLYSRFNRVPAAHAAVLATGPLRHDPAHRGTLAYKNPGLQTQFGNSARTLSRTTPGTGQNFTGNNPTSGSPKGRSTITNSTTTNITNNNNVTINKNTTNRTVNSGNTVGNTNGNTVGNTNRTITGNNTTSGNTTNSRTITGNATGNKTITGGTTGNKTTGGNAMMNSSRAMSLSSGNSMARGPAPSKSGGNNGGNKKGQGH